MGGRARVFNVSFTHCWEACKSNSSRYWSVPSEQSPRVTHCSSDPVNLRGTVLRSSHRTKELGSEARHHDKKRQKQESQPRPGQPCWVVQAEMFRVRLTRVCGLSNPTSTEREGQLCGICCGGAISSSSCPRAWQQQCMDKHGGVSSAWLDKQPGRRNNFPSKIFHESNNQIVAFKKPIWKRTNHS